MTTKQKLLCLFERLVPRPAGPPPTAPRRFLLWSITHLGDSVLQLPAATALKHAFPDCHVGMVVKTAYHALVELNPHVDRIYCYDPRWSTLPDQHRSGLKETAHLRRQLADYEAAFIFDFHPLSRLLLRATGIPILVGYGPPGRCLSISPPDPPPQQHRLEDGMALLAAVGVPAGPIDFGLQMSESARRRAAELLQQEGWRGARLLGLCPSSGNPEKCWPPERFAAVANHLVREQGYQVVLLGSPRDREPAEAAAKALQVPALNLVGRTQVQELAAVLSACELVLTNDSGAMHLAAVLGCAVVALFGPTDPRKWGPRGIGQLVVVQSPTGKMHDITLEQVLGALAAQLSARRNTRSGAAS